jgi:hypothetical protein
LLTGLFHFFHEALINLMITEATANIQNHHRAGQNNTDYVASGQINTRTWTKAVQPESTANHAKHANANQYAGNRKTKLNASSAKKETTT